MKRLPGSRPALCVVVTLCIGTIAIDASASGFVTTRDTAFIDAEGRHLILHGINVINKNKADGYVPWQTLEDFVRLRGWGMNCVRLGILWDGIEPSPGQYDESYLAMIDERIAWCRELGLYVMLDMHQDLFGVLYSDGAPAWATLSEGKPHIALGGVWSDAYFTSPAVQTAFDNFWANTPGPDGVGIQDRFARVWKTVAKRYADEPAVIGYDLFNEPNMGSDNPTAQYAMIAAFAAKLRETLGDAAPPEEHILAQWLDPAGRAQLMEHLKDIEIYRGVLSAVEPLFAEFERTKVMPMYRRVAAAIREVDANHIVFLETSMASNMGVVSAVEPLTRADGTRDPHQAYTPHAYDIVVDTPQQAQASQARIALIFDHQAATAQRLDMPMLVGEWGAYGGADETILPAAWAVVRQFEKHLASETYWDYGRTLGEAAYRDVLVRPLPVSVAGALVSYKSDDAARTFSCVWNENPVVTAPTQIFLPARYLETASMAVDGISEGFEVTRGESGSATVTIHGLGKNIERRFELRR